MNIDIGFCGMTIMEKDFLFNKVKSRQYDEEKVSEIHILHFNTIRIYLNELQPVLFD